VARKRYIEEGLIDYSGDSDDDNKSKKTLPEDAFR